MRHSFSTVIRWSFSKPEITHQLHYKTSPPAADSSKTPFHHDNHQTGSGLEKDFRNTSLCRSRRRWLIFLTASLAVTLTLTVHCTQLAILLPSCADVNQGCSRGPARLSRRRRLNEAVSDDEQWENLTGMIEVPSVAEFDQGSRRSEETKQRLPQCIIIGVRKGGTRALIEFLDLHPAVQAQKEELHFFDDDQNYSLGLEWYRRRMPHSFDGQITVEKTPGYFVTDGVPERIYSMNRTVRLLVIVRDPVQRAISDYAQIHAARLRRGKYHPRFEELAVDPLTGEVDATYRAVRRSIYHVDMARWLRVFQRQQFHFVNGENLVMNPTVELHRVEEFLGLDHRINASMFYLNETRGFYCIRGVSGGVTVGVVGGVAKNESELLLLTTDSRSQNVDRFLYDVDAESRLGPPTDDNVSTVADRGSEGDVEEQVRCLASSKGRPHPTIAPRVVNKLRRFFKPLNRIFYEQVGTDFGWL